MSEYTGAVADAPMVLPRQWPDLDQPNALEQIGAGLQLENTVVGGLTQRVVPPPEDTGVFKAEWDVRDVVSFDEFMSGRFDSARDERQVEAIRENVRREERLRSTLERGPLAPIVVGLFAAGVDPFTYIGPFAAPMRTLGIGGRALGGAADAALGVGATEIALSTQNLRSGSDALASMLLSATFGGSVMAMLGRAPSAPHVFGDPINPTAKYKSLQDELSAYMQAVAKDEGSLARLSDTTAVGRFLESPTLKWTFERNPPPPGVIDDANLLRFAMGRNTRLFDAVEAAAAKIEALDNPLSLAIARTEPDLTPSRLERQTIIERIVELEGRDNPAALAARAEGKSLDDVLAAMDAAPSARKDPLATAQAAALRQRLAELDSVLPLRVADEAGPLTWQVSRARDAAIKEYQDALAKLHAQLDRERAKAAKLTANLGKEGTLEAHARIMELKDALARGAEVDTPKGNWLDEIVAANPPKKGGLDKVGEHKGATARREQPAQAQAKGESIDFIGLCGGL